MRYVLTRKGDGHTNTGTLIGTRKSELHFPDLGHRPRKGYAFVVLNEDLKGRQTSTVTEITLDTDQRVEFRTRNSEYVLEILPEA